MKSEFVETVSNGDDKIPCGRFTILIPLSDLVDLASADLTSSTQPSATVCRPFARDIAAETQRAISSGELIIE